MNADLEVGSRSRGVDGVGASGRQGNDLETFDPFPAKLAPRKFNFTTARSKVHGNRIHRNCTLVNSSQSRLGVTVSCLSMAPSTRTSRRLPQQTNPQCLMFRKASRSVHASSLFQNPNPSMKCRKSWVFLSLR